MTDRYLIRGAWALTQDREVGEGEGAERPGELIQDVGSQEPPVGR